MARFGNFLPKVNTLNLPPVVSSNKFRDTPPLWTDLVKMLTRKLTHTSSFSLECTDFKNLIFEKIHLAHSEDTKVAKVKRPRNPK